VLLQVVSWLDFVGMTSCLHLYSSRCRAHNPYTWYLYNIQLNIVVMKNRNDKKAMTAGNGKTAMPGCEVCFVADNQGKYKCPNCLLRYCSVSCYREHKNAPCEKKEPASTAAHGRKRARESTRDDFFPVPSSIARKHHSDLAATQAVDDQEEEEDDGALLTDDMRKALMGSKWLQGALEDSTLCSLLTDIDSDRHRAQRLSEELNKYPELKSFVDRVLLEIGALKYEEGHLVLT